MLLWLEWLLLHIFFRWFCYLLYFRIYGEANWTKYRKCSKSGSALAFVAYPEVCTYIRLLPVWYFLFFFMLLILGIGSMLAHCASLTTAIIDQFSLTKKKHYVVIVICFIMFVGDITMCFSEGLYMVDLLDNVSLCWILCCAHC